LDFIFLSTFAVTGFAFFLIAAVNEINFRTIAYLLNYISPLIIVSATIFALCILGDRVRLIIGASIMLWVLIGIIQLIFGPDIFVSIVLPDPQIANDIWSSGRGVVSLAPEPTHFGFQLLLLCTALVLLRGNSLLVILAVFAVVLLSRSTTAILAIALGGILWLGSKPTRWPFLMLFGIVGIIAIQFVNMLQPSSRPIVLLQEFASLGPKALLNDFSATMRFAGIVAPIHAAISGGLVPLGLEHTNWLKLKETIVYSTEWVVDLSNIGPASGFGVVIVQLGFLSLPFISYFGWKLLSRKSNGVQTLFCSIATIIFLGQLYLATPTFSFVMACTIASVYRFANHSFDKNTIRVIKCG
jgi:hypothetical protein